MSIEKILFTLYSAVMIGAASIFDFLMELALKGVNIIPGKAIDNIMEKIYVLLSVVMLFYMAITLLTYLVSPNKLTDSSKGGPKVIVKIIVTLVLLVFTPTIFDLAQDLQTAILSENVIGKIILSQDNSDTVNLNKSSDTLIYGITRAILKPKEDAPNKDGDVDDYYADTFFDADIPNKVGDLGNLETYAANKEDFDFNPIIGITCGVLVILVLFGFCFDIAIRIFKLAALKIIAPFPIITNMLPNEKGNKLSKYGGECISTYAILFIDIGLLDFGVYLIEVIDLDFRGVSENWLIVAMCYVGLLLFLKQAPKLFSDILGIKSQGNFTMNPMKRIREVPGLGSAVQTAGAAAGGFVTGTALGFKAAGGFKGIGQGFKNGGFMGGMKKIGTMAGMSGRGMIFGGRAGFQQTKLMGVAAKDQKIDKTAYRAGGSAVSKAATGDENASTGFPDSFFNGMSVKLNKPAFDRKKEIENAEKNYTKEADLSAVYKDSQREILSSKGAADAKRDALLKQLNQYDSSRANSIAEAIKNDSNINNLTNELNDVNRELKGFEYTDFASRRSLQEHLLVKLQNDLSMEYDLAESVRIKEEINETIDYINKINEKEKEYTTLQTWKTEVENKMKDRRTEVTNQTISNFEQKHGNRDVIERDYNIAESVSANYEKQYDDISKKVVDQEAKTSNAKATLNRLKQEDKDAVGKFKKYE